MKQRGFRIFFVDADVAPEFVATPRGETTRFLEFVAENADLASKFVTA